MTTFCIGESKKNAGKILEILERQIEMFSDKRMFKKFRIDSGEAQRLVKILETIRLNLIKRAVFLRP